MPFKLIPDTAEQKLKRYLPPDYVVKKVEVAKGEPEKFEIKAYFNSELNDVATAVVNGEEFKIEFSEEAFSISYFNSWMISRYPEIDPDRLLWLVVYRWGHKYTYLGKPFANSGLALKKIPPSAFDKEGSYLVAFKASEWPCKALKVDQSYSIKGDLEFHETGENEGEKIFLFTGDE